MYDQYYQMVVKINEEKIETDRRQTDRVRKIEIVNVLLNQKTMQFRTYIHV